MKIGQYKMVFSLIIAVFLFTNVAFASGWLTDKNGCKVWSNSDSLDGLSFKWSGTVVDGYAEGKGVLELYKNGNLDSRYEGTMRMGKRDGKGSYTWPDGEKYDGDFVDGNMTGKGIYTWSNGNKYEGDWVGGKRTGKGIFTSTNGDKYEGDWVSDKMTGKGIYTFANGDKYVGDFIDGKVTGKGIYTFSSGSGGKYEGDFVNFKWTGKGILTFTNGVKYEGDFVDSNMTGKGILTSKDGVKSEGDFVNGNMVKGSITYVEKQVSQAPRVRSTEEIEKEQQLKKQLNDVTWEYNDAKEKWINARKSDPIFLVGGGEIRIDNGDELYLVDATAVSYVITKNYTGINVKIINPDRNLIVDTGFGKRYYNPYGQVPTLYFLGTETGYNSFGMPVPIDIFGPNEQLTRNIQELENIVEKIEKRKSEVERQLKIVMDTQKKEDILFMKQATFTSEQWFKDGNSFFENRDYRSAIESYTRAIQLNPQFADAYNNRGRNYYYIGESDTAINDFNMAIQLNPQFAKAYYNRGMCYYGKGQWDLAIKDFTMAIQLNPQFARAYYDRGDSHQKTGENNQAIIDYKKFIQYASGDDNYLIEGAKKEIRKLGGSI